MQAPICRVCGTKHWGGEHVFPQSPLCQKCGEPTGVDKTGKPRWCKCVRDTAAAANQIIRTVMAKPVNGKHAPATPSQTTNDVIPGKINRAALPSNTRKDKPAVASSPRKDIVVGEISTHPMADTPETAPLNGKTDRKKYLREYMQKRRQKEREESQRTVEAGTGATDQ